LITVRWLRPEQLVFSCRAQSQQLTRNPDLLQKVGVFAFEVHMNIYEDYLSDTLGELRKLKKLAERAIDQVSDEQLFLTIDPESNSIAVIVRHIAGNMRSRWTDFLTSDGEKPDRNRDGEFIISQETTRTEVMSWWEGGWELLFSALTPLRPDDFTRTITIRGEPHTIVQAINRQLVHYASHIGQVVFLAKHLKSSEWKTLSVPKKR